MEKERITKQTQSDNESHKVSSSPNIETVTSASLPTSQQKTNLDTTNFSSKIGLTNVEIGFTADDFKSLRTYHEFYVKFKPVILSANATAKMEKVNIVVASKWKEFLKERKEKEVHSKQMSNNYQRAKPSMRVLGKKVNLHFQSQPNPILFSAADPDSGGTSESPRYSRIYGIVSVHFNTIFTTFQKW